MPRPVWGHVAQKLVHKLKPSEKFLGSSWISVRRLQGPQRATLESGPEPGARTSFVWRFSCPWGPYTLKFMGTENVFSKFIAKCVSARVYLCLERVPAAAAAAKLLQSCPTLCDPIEGCSPLGCPVPGILQARTLEWVAISFSNAWKWKVKVKSLSRVWLLATPWTAAYQTPPSMGFSRQEYWSGVPLPSLERVPTAPL